jgi:WD40-like Beta Propeller Repeat
MGRTESSAVGGSLTSRHRRGAYVALAGLSVVAVVNAAGAPRVASGRLVFATAGDQTNRLELAVVNPDGSGMRKITHHRPAGFAPQWTSDGRKLIFRSHDLFTGHIAFWRMNRDGRRLERLPGSAGDVVSPSGEMVAVPTKRGVDIVDARGRRLRRIRAPVRQGWDVESGFGSPVWSPDERFLAFAIGDTDGDSVHVCIAPTQRGGFHEGLLSGPRADRKAAPSGQGEPFPARARSRLDRAR